MEERLESPYSTAPNQTLVVTAVSKTPFTQQDNTNSEHNSEITQQLELLLIDYITAHEITQLGLSHGGRVTFY